MPSPELLYTQKVRVVLGTRENTVSSLTVSVENVRVLPTEVENVSSSVQAARMAARAIIMIVAYFFIKVITENGKKYCVGRRTVMLSFLIYPPT